MTTGKISLEPALFRPGDGMHEGVLLGSKCQSCGRLFFPPREWCAACCEPSCRSAELSRHGELRSYTVVQRKTTYSLVTAPYILAEIALPEGIFVYATLNLSSSPTADGYHFHTLTAAGDLAALSIGQRVALSEVTIKKDPNGNDVVAYNFRTDSR